MSAPKLSAKDQVLEAMHRLEAVVERFGLPCVCLVVLPRSQEVVKMAGGLSRENLPKVAKITAEYLREQAKKVEHPINGGRR